MALLALVVLAVVGIVLSAGSDSLVVTGGIAQTTDLHADWDCAWTNDDGVTTDCTADGFGDEPAGDDALDPHGSFSFPYASPFVEKDVGSCLAAILPEDSAPEGEQAVTVTIGNAYPSYECTFAFLFTNTGSVPFSIGGYETDVQSPLELLNDTCIIRTPDGTQEEVELDVGESAAVECTVHVMQEAEQSQVYQFTVNACAPPCGAPLVRWSIPDRFRDLAFRSSLPATISVSISSGSR